MCDVCFTLHGVFSLKTEIVTAYSADVELPDHSISYLEGWGGFQGDTRSMTVKEGKGERVPYSTVLSPFGSFSGFAKKLNVKL